MDGNGSPAPAEAPADTQQAQPIDKRDFANPTIQLVSNASRATSVSGETDTSSEGPPPPLPPRPRNLALLDSRPGSSHSRPTTSHSLRPQLQSRPTTQLSYADTHTYNEELREASRSPSSGTSRQTRNYFGINASRNVSDTEDTASVKSLAPAGDVGGIDAESMLGEVLDNEEKSLFKSLGHRFHEAESVPLFPEDPQLEDAFAREFDEIEDMKPDGSNEETVMQKFRSKLKHFLILSSAGKPVYSRHGDDQVVGNYLGVLQTLISFYEGRDDHLRSFTAGDNVRFVVMTKGPLHLVAISKLREESDTQLRSQLDALYMQILSTLTLPTLERMFATRASYDLRRPLQGTETLISALADGFTRGSPSTLLSAIECLKLRKSHRHVINSTFLKMRCSSLLYGLIVAGGRLVSVVRPKKHSLHPGDLHLIFNMLFEAGSVKAGGGENWIPLCLPGFNNTGFLYMYVSFLDLEHPGETVQSRRDQRPASAEGRGGEEETEEGVDEVAIILISADKESFFELRGMRDELVESLHKNHSITHIRGALSTSRPSIPTLLPGSPLLHFLYKSRGNVQFVSPSYSPSFPSPYSRRLLISLYSHLHSSLHSGKGAGHAKVVHEVHLGCSALAWMSPMFEVYCVARKGTEKKVLVKAAEKVVQWVRREEERVFIIGGAVF